MLHSQVMFMQNKTTSGWVTHTLDYISVWSQVVLFKNFVVRLDRDKKKLYINYQLSQCDGQKVQNLRLPVIAFAIYISREVAGIYLVY